MGIQKNFLTNYYKKPDFIKEKQPLLTLHGHIHEAPDAIKGMWINHIGSTICINPGQTEIGSDELVYALIDLDKGLFLRKKQDIKLNNKNFVFYATKVMLFFLFFMLFL